MAIRRINVGKAQFGNGKKLPSKVKPFKTEKMFRNLEALNKRVEELKLKKFEVIPNEKLLTLQYR